MTERTPLAERLRQLGNAENSAGDGGGIGAYLERFAYMRLDNYMGNCPEEREALLSLLQIPPFMEDGLTYGDAARAVYDFFDHMDLERGMPRFVQMAALLALPASRQDRWAYSGIPQDGPHPRAQERPPEPCTPAWQEERLPLRERLARLEEPGLPGGSDFTFLDMEASRFCGEMDALFRQYRVCEWANYGRHFRKIAGEAGIRMDATLYEAVRQAERSLGPEKLANAYRMIFLSPFIGLETLERRTKHEP